MKFWPIPNTSFSQFSERQSIKGFSRAQNSVQEMRSLEKCLHKENAIASEIKKNNQK